jgi:hypothetical protein
MNKKVPIWILLFSIWCNLVVTILFGWAVWHIMGSGSLFKGKVGAAIIAIASFPSTVKESYETLIRSSIFVRPDEYPAISGLKMGNKVVDSDYILLPTYNKRLGQSVVKLLRLSDQKSIYQWTPNIDELKRMKFKEHYAWQNTRKSDFDISHPLISADGSLIFHSLVLNALLIKIDKNSKILWVLNGNFHHSIEYDADRNIWIGSFMRRSKFLNNFFKDYDDCSIDKISPDGKILYEKSVAEILVENGYRGLLLGSGAYEKDMLHLNDIQPALSDTKYWKRGDLLISVRNKSTVFLFRPSTNKILWLKTGPWLNQHDVDFVDSTSGFRLLDGYNEEYVYDFKENSIKTPYSIFLKKAMVSTSTAGRSDILSNGDIFIEETEKNRLLRGNIKNTIWQYVNRIDQHSVAAITWSRFLSKKEFMKLTFLQP